MASYLVVKNNNQTKSYELKNTNDNAPYIKVSSYGYLDLTTNTTVGVKLNIKNDNQTYRALEKKTITETIGYLITSTSSSSASYQYSRYSATSTQSSLFETLYSNETGTTSSYYFTSYKSLQTTLYRNYTYGTLTRFNMSYTTGKGTAGSISTTFTKLYKTFQLSTSYSGGATTSTRTWNTSNHTYNTSKSYIIGGLCTLVRSFVYSNVHYIILF